MRSRQRLQPGRPPLQCDFEPATLQLVQLAIVADITSTLGDVRGHACLPLPTCLDPPFSMHVAHQALGYRVHIEIASTVLKSARATASIVDPKSVALEHRPRRHEIEEMVADVLLDGARRAEIFADLRVNFWPVLAYPR